MRKVSLSPQQQRKLLLGILVALGIIVWANAFLIPQRRIVSQTQAKVLRMQGMLDQSRREIAQLSAQEQEIAQLSQQLGAVDVTKTPDEQLPDLLKSLGDLAHRSKARFIGAKPTTDINKLRPGPNGYLDLQVMVVVMGGYHEISSFVDSLESSDLLVRVRELMILHPADSSDFSLHPAVLLLQAYLVPGGSPRVAKAA